MERYQNSSECEALTLVFSLVLLLKNNAELNKNISDITKKIQAVVVKLSLEAYP